LYNSLFLPSTNTVAYYLHSVESILSAGAELAIAKLLVGKVVGASKCGSGLLVDCGGKKLGRTDTEWPRLCIHMSRTPCQRQLCVLVRKT